MNKYLAMLALTAALGAASASAAGTVAGTTISNTASATFSDANGGNSTTVYSNNNTPVTTSVSAVPSFTITPNSTGTPGANGFAAGTGNELSVIPGQANVVFKYTLTNTGNVPGENYSLSRLTYNSGSAGISNVRYYLDNPSGGAGTVGQFDAGDTQITGDKITGVAPDAAKVFFVVFDVPNTAANAQQFAITPVGSRDANSTYDGGATFSLSDGDNYGRATVTRVDANTLGPKNDADADGTIDANNPDGAAVGALPASYTVANGTNPATSTTVSYSTAAKDTQTATALASTAGQTVTFVNTVRNKSNIADSFTLSVPDATALDQAGFPTGSTAQILKTDGTALAGNTTPSLAGDPGGNGAGGEYSFLVRVTLPAHAAPDASGTVPGITVRAASVNMTSVSDTTTDYVKIESGLFGNATPGTPGAPAADPTLNPTKSGNPGDVVYIPMDLYNSGNLTDAYTVAGSVTFTDGNGAPIVAPISYYVAKADGTPDLTQPVTTSSVAPGVELKLVGQVTVPTGAVNGTATVAQSAVLKDGSNNTVITYGDNNDTISVGLVGGVVVKKYVDDTGANDNVSPYPAEPAYTVVPGTYNAGSKALPGDVLRYVIYGRNERNAVVKSFVLSDSVLPDTTFYGVAATYNAGGSTYATGKSAGAKVMYKVGGGTWSATAPTDTTLAAGTVISVGYDWNNDGDITAADVLPAGAELKLVFKVKVK